MMNNICITKKLPIPWQASAWTNDRIRYCEIQQCVCGENKEISCLHVIEVKIKTTHFALFTSIRLRQALAKILTYT